MTPDKAELLHRLRREITDRQRSLDGFEERGMRLLNDRNEDVSPVFVEQLRAKIDEMQALVEKHDPDGFTVLR